MALLSSLLNRSVCWGGGGLIRINIPYQTNSNYWKFNMVTSLKAERHAKRTHTYICTYSSICIFLITNIYNIYNGTLYTYMYIEQCTWECCGKFIFFMHYSDPFVSWRESISKRGSLFDSAVYYTVPNLREFHTKFRMEATSSVKSGMIVYFIAIIGLVTCVWE